MPQIRGWAGGLMMLSDTGDEVCVQWARQMPTAALTIPQGEYTSSGTVLDLRLPYHCTPVAPQGLSWSNIVS